MFSAQLQVLHALSIVHVNVRYFFCIYCEAASSMCENKI